MELNFIFKGAKQDNIISFTVVYGNNTFNYSMNEDEFYNQYPQWRKQLQKYTWDNSEIHLTVHKSAN